MNSITTVLELGGQRHCFLTHFNSFQSQKKHLKQTSSTRTRDDGINVYEAEVRTKGKVYFSTHGSQPPLLSGDKVQLTALYADKLGLKDNEPLLLKLLTASLPSAKKVHVEPLSIDDWEIVEQNSRHIENVLLDQIRVIWPGQTFPLWIYRSTCVFMRIVSVEPMSFCVILESNTDLIVSSKVRVPNPPKSLGLPGPVASPAMSPPRQQTPGHQTACKSWGSSDQDSSLNETPLDTLEPRPSIKSPSRSPRLSGANRKRGSLKNQQFSVNDRMPERMKPMLRRQSSLMESVMRYVFGFIEKKEDLDNLSESDASSGIDYTLEKLPSRNGVLRVQPMRLSCSLEDTFPVAKQELHRQIMSKRAWTVQRKSPSHQDIGEKLQENYFLPCELFQPSTVYVDIESTKIERDLHPFLPRLPYNLIAKLQRLPSPQEKAEAASKASKKVKDKQDKTATATSSSSAPQSRESRGGARGSKKEVAPEVQPTEKPDVDFENINASCYVRVVVIDRKAGLTDENWQEAADRLLSEQPLMTGHVIIPDLLRRQLKLDSTGSVWLQTGSLEFIIPKKICIYPLSTVPRRFSNDLLINAFKTHLKLCANEAHPLVIFQGLFLKFMVVKDHAMEVQITFYGENDLANPTAVSMLSEMNIESVLVLVERDLQNDKMGVINPLLPYSKASDFDPMPPTVKLKHLGGMDKVAKLGLAYLQACVGSRPLSRTTFMASSGLSHGILLITGPKGSGKSSLSKALCRKMAQMPTLAHITLVDCKNLRGKTVTHIQKIMESVFDEAAWRQPSIIVFDNLDAIMPTPSGPESEMMGESLYSAKNSQVFQGLVKYEMENNSCLGVIATCCSKSNLHPSLVSSRGSHLVQETLNIGSPDLEVRSKILSCMLQHHSSISIETLKTINLQPISVKTEGFVARDLECLISRSIHNRLVKDPKAADPKVTLKQDDVEEVLETFKPVSIRGVPLHQAGELGWEDVGGLNDVKKALIETLKWPSKYPQLFGNCPLRLRSGVMLYGAPGTGKTLLAGIVAKECELNFISIKGPELLSKYIGASEQAVRDLFTRAQSAKPCILFFDEFDSIAPKRGHDSTGVTDRVVNQLLTQLDGVEGLQGVYVLAATSRPDLIDPALLRPGRLDKSLICSMPNQGDRVAILKALTMKMCLCYDVRLDEIASMCEHFTGADLKALLYNAQLKAIHEISGIQLDDDPTMVRIKANDDECPAVLQATEMFDQDFRDKLDEARGRSSSTKTSPEVMPSLDPRRFREPSEESSISDQSKVTDAKAAGMEKGRSGSMDIDLNSSEVSDGQSDCSSRDVTATGLEEELNTLQESGSYAVKPWSPRVDDESSKYLESESHLDVEASVPKMKLEVQGEKLQLLNGSVPLKDQPPEGLDDVDGLSPVYEEAIDSQRASSFIALTSTPKKQSVDESCNKAIPALNIESIEEDALTNMPDPLPLCMKGSSSMNLPDPSQTYPPSATRRKRSFERTQSCSEPTKETIGVELKTLTVDKPVTVFSSLELGLATLSPEDEAKYMAIAREIVRRDDRMFNRANDRRRTSFMQASRTSRLREVCHRHLVEAARATRPSVTAQERAKYLSIYDQFVDSRTAAFDKKSKTGDTETKRTTLA